MKKVLFLLALLCTACTQTHKITSFFDVPETFSNTPEIEKNVRVKTVSMLLPLTGNKAVMGQDMQNAALMALRDEKNAPMRLLFFDTQGTPEGAKEAYNWAKAQNSDMILGPVFSSEVAAINTGFSSGANLLTYTSDSTVLDASHASFSMLIPNQIDTIIQQLCSEGKTRLAALGSESKTGQIVMNSLDKAIKKCPNMELVKYGLYGETEENLTPAILKIAPKFVDPKKKDLTEEEQQILATPIQERLDFDALIVFEEGIRLSQAMAILAFYDVSPDVVPIYTLASVKSMKDKALNGVFMADLPTQGNAAFTRKYLTTFEQNPSQLASLAYDSVRWIAQNADQDTLNLKTLQAQGTYQGVDGLIRLNEDGTNKRALRLVQKKGRNVQEIIPAPTELESEEFPFMGLEEESTDLTLTPPEALDESLGNAVQSNPSEVPVESPLY